MLMGRLYLLLKEINTLKKSMIKVYEKNESLQDPKLIQLSKNLDLRLNEFRKFTKLK